MVKTKKQLLETATWILKSLIDEDYDLAKIRVKILLMDLDDIGDILK